jgi:2-dehydro-3-deoxygluconokinase
MIYDLVALGETMMTFCPPPGEVLGDSAILNLDHGGAESNTCVGLARLGLKVAWVSKLGCDPFGDRVLEALQLEGIDTGWVKRDSSRPTGLMIKDPANRRVHYYRAGSAASSITPDDLISIPFVDASAVLVTGITAQIGVQPQAAAMTFLERARGLRVVDPNFRQGLWGSERRCELVLPLIQRCDLVLAGDQELAELFGNDEPKEMAKRCSEHGPHEVVIRGDGMVGVWNTSDGWCDLKFPTEDAPDPMGAGDAFNAGYIAAKLTRRDLATALQLAIRCGRAVATCAGDTSGFPKNLRIAK